VHAAGAGALLSLARENSHTQTVLDTG